MARERILQLIENDRPRMIGATSKPSFPGAEVDLEPGVGRGYGSGLSTDGVGEAAAAIA